MPSRAHILIFSPNLTEMHILNVFFKQYFYLVFFICQCIYSRGNTTAKGGCAALEGSSGPASKGIPHGQPHGIHLASTRVPREIHASSSRAPCEPLASTHARFTREPTRADRHSPTPALPFSIGVWPVTLSRRLVFNPSFVVMFLILVSWICCWS